MLFAAYLVPLEINLLTIKYLMAIKYIYHNKNIICDIFLFFFFFFFFFFANKIVLNIYLFAKKNILIIFTKIFILSSKIYI